jgi:hypothetical protein
MKDTQEIVTELTGAGDVEAWRVVLEDLAEERGYFDALGEHHCALFADAGEVLLVTFEDEAAVRSRDDMQPLGWALSAPHDWSSLVLMSRGQTWFRDPQVYAFFDRLVDDAFFDDYTQVMFLGSGAGGYAAAAFSVTATGATVFALAPQATLTPAVAGWDRRFPQTRHVDFTSRYGYAPAMIEATSEAYVIFDPAIAEDAMHAALFAGHGAIPIRARHYAQALPVLLERSGALAAMLDQTASGSLSEVGVYRALRARRKSAAWLKRFLAIVRAAGDPRRTQRLARYVLAIRNRAPTCRRALEGAERELADVAPSAPKDDTAS